MQDTVSEKPVLGKPGLGQRPPTQEEVLESVADARGLLDANASKEEVAVALGRASARLKAFYNSLR